MISFSLFVKICKNQWMKTIKTLWNHFENEMFDAIYGCHSHLNISVCVFFCFKMKKKCGKQFVFRFFPRIRKFANAVHSQNQMNWIFVDLADKYLKDHFQIFFLFRYFSCINNNKQSPIWNARDLFIEASDDFETRN